MPTKSMPDDAASKTVSKSYSVEIKDFAFGPTTITVPAGAQVTWVNKDEEPHTVFSTDNTFKSKALDTDDKFSFTFAKPGTYKYFCSVHPKMVGTVVVEDSMKKHPMKMGKMN
ncbi:MAG: cupredoxin domain-containing protein [Candidatus Acidiferrales bacterium]